LDHTTVSPTATVSSAGTNAKFWTLTRRAVGAGFEHAAIATTALVVAIAIENERSTYFASDA
jgi:hypothetical protein